MMLNFTDPFFTTRVLGFEPLFDRFQRLSESSQRSSGYLGLVGNEVVFVLHQPGDPRAVVTFELERSGAVHLGVEFGQRA